MKFNSAEDSLPTLLKQIDAIRRENHEILETLATSSRNSGKIPFVTSSKMASESLKIQRIALLKEVLADSLDTADFHVAARVSMQVLAESPEDQQAKMVLRVCEKQGFNGSLEQPFLSYSAGLYSKFMAGEQLRVGLAVLIHDRPDYLRLCLDSLFSSRIDNIDLTILLQNDGSLDPDVQKIIDLPRDERFRVIRWHKKKGPNSWGAAFNSAMRHLSSTGEFDVIGSCDSDAYFHPQWLQRSLPLMIWAKENHSENVLGPFSCFNSSDYLFHQIEGFYDSPHGMYAVKQRMGALVYLFIQQDLRRLGNFPENRDDETQMTKRFEALGVHNFCSYTSYVEHIGEDSVLNKWRPTPVRSPVYAINLIADGWHSQHSLPLTCGMLQGPLRAESCAPGVTSAEPLEVFITLARKDAEIMPLTVSQLRKHLKHPISRIYAICQSSRKLDELCRDLEITYIDEEDVLPGLRKELYYVAKGIDRTEWLLQQFIKLSLDRFCMGERFLLLDSDTVFLRPQVFIVEGKEVLLHSSEFNYPYFQVFEKVFGSPAASTMSCVSHQMLFSKTNLADFKREIEEIHCCDWISALLQCVEYKEFSGFSEFELYGQWLISRRTDAIIREYFFNISLRRELTKVFPQVEKSFGSTLRSVSFHSYLGHIWPLEVRILMESRMALI